MEEVAEVDLVLEFLNSKNSKVINVQPFQNSTSQFKCNEASLRCRRWPRKDPALSSGGGG
jgi:hypothetical protein